MKLLTPAVAAMFMVLGSSTLFAEERAVMDEPTEAAISSPEASSPDAAQASQAAHRMQHQARHGQDHDGGQHCKGNGKRGKHDEVIKRLDMIEARMAKIEIMLESLMQR